MQLIMYILIVFGSIASIGFGVWHFFVPRMWNWYSYIESNATELLIAVRAINIFFSVSLILFGLMNITMLWRDKSNQYSLIIVIGATSVLWLLRVVLQIIYPQGSINPVLKIGMLIAFIVIFLCYAISLVIIAMRNVS